jgi:tetratricopeptide (TPR) repeat protein
LAALAPLSKLRGLRPFHDLHHALINDVTTDREAAAKGYDALAANTKGSFLRLTQLLGNWYERAGDKSRARDIYAGHLKRNRDSLIIRSALLRLEAGKPPGRLVGSATDGAAEALFNLATLLHEENVQEIALILARLALHLRADFSLAQILVANIFEATDRRADAVVAYEAINPRAPISWSARLRAAYNLDRLGRTEEALTRLNRMAAERADRADVLVSKGDILRFKKRYVEAVETYNAAIKRLGKLEQQHWSLLYSRGVVLERAKRWKRAEADFLAALKLRPDQPLVLNYLGYSWVDQGQNLDRALGMIEKAVKLRPNDGYITDSLGWAHYRLGRFEKAVVYLERAVELSPRDATINDHLGDAYWHVGRKTEARFQWQRALALGPEPGEAGKIERKLARGLKSRKPAKREALGAEQDLRGG